ncbi:MAG: hypothetical protein M3Z25_19790 [Actinomycetota bacterium]|nr:hypothetical protein [Actinomycetota bacterium]
MHSLECAVWAGDGLLGVADGFGPSTETAMPSAAALNTLATSTASAGALLDALRTAVEQAADKVATMTTSDPALEGAGTTLTALAWSGAELALVHVGNSRAYLLCDGELLQLSHDDALVQSLIDEGRLTSEEAESHPQRMILIRAFARRRDHAAGRRRRVAGGPAGSQLAVPVGRSCGSRS